MLTRPHEPGLEDGVFQEPRACPPRAERPREVSVSRQILGIKPAPNLLGTNVGPCYGQSKEKSQTVHSTKKLDLEREEKKKNYRSVS
jgi:hypothetical protein